MAKVYYCETIIIVEHFIQLIVIVIVVVFIHTINVAKVFFARQ